MKKILIIEDDLNLQQELKTLLERSNYIGIILNDFENILDNIFKIQPDLILLDISLPHCNGEYLLKDLRKKSDIPVIMVTSFNNEADEVLSMSYGADDYITKPYNPTLLLLRMESIFKRMEREVSSYHYRHIEIIPDRGIMISNGQDFYLTKNEMLILKYLVLHQNIIVSREDIMRYLWDSEEFVDDNTLSVNISRLRGKLNDVGLEDVIETRKGQGYLLK